VTNKGSGTICALAGCVPPAAPGVPFTLEVPQALSCPWRPSVSSLLHALLSSDWFHLSVEYLPQHSPAPQPVLEVLSQPLLSCATLSGVLTFSGPTFVSGLWGEYSNHFTGRCAD
jgi:hypothetical protein